MEKLKIQLFAEGEDANLLEEQYLEQIAELKRKMDEETVSKEEYEKLLAEHKKLTNDYINRRPKVKVEVKREPAKVYAEKLQGIEQGDISNYDYVKTALDYRDAYLYETGKDVFSNFTKEGPGEPTKESIKVAEGLRQVVDESENPEDFRMRLQIIMKDDPRILSMINKRQKRR